MTATVTTTGPGAVLRNVAIRGDVSIEHNGATVSGVQLIRAAGDLATPAAFVLGAVLGALVWRWGR
ncbi:hypothetical protein [Pseudokineococcus lusitanus]|uniref:Uncharacterized protein n=1 Tax=Pseudokineococcus lusitanus TaxID=763993 RepID=A0A3N1HU18_9ACTN|nr:hypothetical protein [Pseudokineococcus lusitanus]ROP45920.1 hypothetical protein EDC03_0535 [Pseudokineococcus lusitanus]